MLLQPAVSGENGPLEVCHVDPLVLGRHHSEKTSPGNPLNPIVRLSPSPTLSSFGAIWSPGLNLKDAEVVPARS